MAESSQSSASRVLAILMACLTALLGFFAFVPVFMCPHYRAAGRSRSYFRRRP